MGDRLKFSLCTEMIFGGEPLHEILPAVRDAGYGAFEFWHWGNKDIAAIEAAMATTGLKTATFCVKNGNLVDEAKRGEFIDGLKETLPVAKRLGCATLITTVGQRLIGVSDDAQTKSVIAGLCAAAPIVEDAGITLAVEPLNILVDHAGYFLDRSDAGFMILAEVGSPNVKLLFDIYHQQITEGNLIANITKNIGAIGHFHAADVPGRHDPGTGEINYLNVVDAIAKTGYDGYFGLEYSPVGDKTASIRNVLKYLNGRA